MNKTMWAVGYISYQNKMYPNPVITEPWVIFSNRVNALEWKKERGLNKVKIIKVRVSIEMARND